MSSGLLPEFPESGSSTENVERNASLEKTEDNLPATSSTGTVAAAIFEGGIVIGTDKRASSGRLVANKNTNKIYKISDNIAFGGAGTAADCDQIGKMIKAHVDLHKLNSGDQVPVRVALTKISQHFSRHQCELIVGGVDKFGYHLHHVDPHGSSSEVLFDAIGSGSLAVISHLELNYKKNMNLDEAKLLIKNAILAGVDLAPSRAIVIKQSGISIGEHHSYGDGIGLCIITPSGMEHLVDYGIPKSFKKLGNYTFPVGTTPILGETIVRELDPDEIMSTFGAS